MENPNKQFKVAYRNTTETSLNGYTGLEMINMFNSAGKIPSNIIFSKEWVSTGKFNGKNQIPIPSTNPLRGKLGDKEWESMTDVQKQYAIKCNK
jgi:hypothetical protein